MGLKMRILAFPIESKSPVESMLFLAALKSKLSKIFCKTSVLFYREHLLLD